MGETLPLWSSEIQALFIVGLQKRAEETWFTLARSQKERLPYTPPLNLYSPEPQPIVPPHASEGSLELSVGVEPVLTDLPGIPPSTSGMAAVTP